MVDSNQHLSRVKPILLVLFGGVLATLLNNFSRSVYPFIFSCLIKAPYISKRISKSRRELKEKFTKNRDEVVQSLKRFNQLPEVNMDDQEILDLVSTHAETGDIKWTEGYISGCVYTVDQNLQNLRQQVMEKFGHSNPLHMEAFPGLVKMETDIVQMVADMFHGDDECIGTVTSGGTESLILAVKTYRDRHISLYKDISTRKDNLILIAPVTIHPAVIKACSYFNIKPILTKINPTSKKAEVDDLISAVKINLKNLCAIFVSAPCFPYGVVDPILEICSAIKNCPVIKRNIPVHVDCCLGGFILPFLKDQELFDFRIPEVTSISCDTHKYGLAPKGTSVLVYRNSHLFEYQIFAYADWTGGLYATANMAGSRSGFLIAACWATMLHIGRRGYEERARKLNEAARYVQKRLLEIGMESLVQGEPEASVVAMTHEQCYCFLDEMKKIGWEINALQDPAGFHVALTEVHLIDNRLDDFLQSCEKVLKKVTIDVVDKTDHQPSNQAVLYGTCNRIPDRSIIEDVATDYLISFYNRYK